MKKHTAKQRRAIKEAYSALYHIVDTMDHSGMIALREAVKSERRERSCLTSAQALLVDCAAKEWPSVAALYGVARGCQLAAILGAEIRDKVARFPAYNSAYHLAKDWARFLELAKESRAAHDAYIHASLDAIKVGGGA